MPTLQCQKANNHKVLKIAHEISSGKKPFTDGKKIKVLLTFCVRWGLVAFGSYAMDVEEYYLEMVINCLAKRGVTASGVGVQ